MTGTRDYTEGVRILRKNYNIPLIFVTLGKGGSRAYYRDLIVEAAPFLQEHTIETTGAGDAVCRGDLRIDCFTGEGMMAGGKRMTKSELLVKILMFWRIYIMDALQYVMSQLDMTKNEEHSCFLGK